jgi:hypothetical protein
MMGNHWCIHLPDFLAENGTIAAYSPRGLRLAKYWTELVAQASNYDESTTVQCRRRPMWMSLVSVILTFNDVLNRTCQFKVTVSPRNLSNFPKLSHPI